MTRGTLCWSLSYVLPPVLCWSSLWGTYVNRLAIATVWKAALWVAHVVGACAVLVDSVFSSTRVDLDIRENANLLPRWSKPYYFFPYVVMSTKTSSSWLIVACSAFEAAAQSLGCKTGEAVSWKKSQSWGYVRNGILWSPMEYANIRRRTQ
jgi:hypothetical protein